MCKKEGGDAVSGLYTPIRYTSAAMTTIHQTDWNTENREESNSTDNFRPLVGGIHSKCLKNILSEFSQSLSSVNTVNSRDNMSFGWNIPTFQRILLLHHYVTPMYAVYLNQRYTDFRLHTVKTYGVSNYKANNVCA